MKNSPGFSGVSKDYANAAVFQEKAGEILFGLLDIRPSEDVLDLGCGPGHLTRKIRQLTDGAVVGVDPSEGMVNEARAKHGGIEFVLSGAEDIGYSSRFDVIFCNSAFMWFEDPAEVLKNCFRALRGGGRMGIQAPGGRIFSPTFLEAMKKVRRQPALAEVLAHFKPPWVSRGSAEEYSRLFTAAGFTVTFSEIRTISTSCPPATAFEFFRTGPAAGYVNQKCYDVPVTPEFQAGFLAAVEQSLHEQARDGIVNLLYSRIFLVAGKPQPQDI